MIKLLVGVLIVLVTVHAVELGTFGYSVEPIWYGIVLAGLYLAYRGICDISVIAAALVRLVIGVLILVAAMQSLKNPQGAGLWISGILLGLVMIVVSGRDILQDIESRRLNAATEANKQKITERMNKGVPLDQIYDEMRSAGAPSTETISTVASVFQQRITESGLSREIENDIFEFKQASSLLSDRDPVKFLRDAELSRLLLHTDDYVSCAIDDAPASEGIAILTPTHFYFFGSKAKSDLAKKGLKLVDRAADELTLGGSTLVQAIRDDSVSFLERHPVASLETRLQLPGSIVISLSELDSVDLDDTLRLVAGGRKLVLRPALPDVYKEDMGDGFIYTFIWLSQIQLIATLHNKHFASPSFDE